MAETAHGDFGNQAVAQAWSLAADTHSCACHGVQVTAVTGRYGGLGRMLRSTLQLHRTGRPLVASLQLVTSGSLRRALQAVTFCAAFCPGYR
ncbi:hypothetical protein XdyCFBP7245_05965 [Xanthomonas dyei]|uniref:Uncharacterized protein n=1 Tax=Xanthomonas dyei TaxID=743699 RepID=A0A2S7C7X9_9XANT|nr:hypothetical protein XdyCFBP7245_05965 [Xanthomonas dyei]